MAKTSKQAAPLVTDVQLQSAILTASDYKKLNDQTNVVMRKVKASEAYREAKARGFEPPLSNTGEKDNTVTLVMENGKPKTVLKRMHFTGQNCIIDAVNIVFHQSTFLDLTNENDVTEFDETCTWDKEVLFNASRQCERIFGFGVTQKRKNGLNFYAHSWDLGEGFGVVCHGGQRDTLLIMIYGTGCAASIPAWENRLFEFIQTSEQGRITRLDLAHDDFEGLNFNADYLLWAYEQGYFTNGQRSPNIQLLGNWLNPNGKGRTIAIGSRENGLFFRGYEKGKELGDVVSPWFRCECEFKNTDRIIPIEALLNPSDYFAASYPIFNNCSESPQRIEIVKKEVIASYERTKRWLRHQCGSALNFMREVENTDTEVLNLVAKEGKLPKGVTPPQIYDTNFIHSTEIKK